MKRYANGFLLGERDVSNNTFPWIEEKYKDDGRRDHTPKASDDEEKWPTKVQRHGIEVSLDIISLDIDLFLSE